MHLFNMATVIIVLSLVGVEFSVAAFIDPAAWRLDPEPQLKLLSRLASVLGKVMPVWYPVSSLLLVFQTWLSWHSSGRGIPFVLFLSISMSITAFPVLARILEERKLQSTSLGATALMCAAVVHSGCSRNGHCCRQRAPTGLTITHGKRHLSLLHSNVRALRASLHSAAPSFSLSLVRAELNCR